MKAEELVFVGFKSRVVALNRQTGEVVWEWKASQGSGFVALLLDGDRLIVSVNGYTYCLEPETGRQLWFNPLEGRGIGVPCLASVNGTTVGALLSAAADEAARQQAASAG